MAEQNLQKLTTKQKSRHVSIYLNIDGDFGLFIPGNNVRMSRAFINQVEADLEFIKVPNQRKYAIFNRTLKAINILIMRCLERGWRVHIRNTPQDNWSSITSPLDSLLDVF